ncbi:uncharacterized protein LOC131658771 [Vicia villosa]|uniref:uncharacterized protein LOC131658771 n=1 Tax=Vicia villosa TaxID=3911 RepID=UPI00273C912C|nr:uncharacterized protein LOC131658771 [Vicia villosa]
MTGNFKKDVLIDVIGVIDAIGYQQTGSGGKNCKSIFNNTMNCTLGKDYAKQFFKFNEENATTSGPTVVLLNYAKFKEQGQYPLSITSTFHVTKLQINPDLPSVKDFINSFSKEALRTVSSQLSSHSQQYSRSSASENVRQRDTQKLLNKVVALPLSQIKQLHEDTFCATVAKTRKLIASSYGWYKIEVEGFHLDTFCKFIFWDRECTQILGISAAQMWDIMIQAGITDPLDFPLKLDAMLDLDLALRVRWQPSWDSCSVIMFVDDKPFVKQFSTPWEPTQIKENVDEANTAAADDCDILTV